MRERCFVKLRRSHNSLFFFHHESHVKKNNGKSSVENGVRPVALEDPEDVSRREKSQDRDKRVHDTEHFCSHASDLTSAIGDPKQKSARKEMHDVVQSVNLKDTKDGIVEKTQDPDDH